MFHLLGSKLTPKQAQNCADIVLLPLPTFDEIGRGAVRFFSVIFRQDAYADGVKASWKQSKWAAVSFWFCWDAFPCSPQARALETLWLRPWYEEFSRLVHLV